MSSPAGYVPQVGSRVLVYWEQAGGEFEGVILSVHLTARTVCVQIHLLGRPVGLEFPFSCITPVSGSQSSP
jgi:hypothetical protein